MIDILFRHAHALFYTPLLPYRTPFIYLYLVATTHLRHLHFGKVIVRAW